MCPAFPDPNYYGASAPPEGHQSATDLPTTAPDGRREGDHGWFPRSPHTDRRGRRPAVIPAASPRLRRRPSPWPSNPALSARPEVGHLHCGRPRTAPRPISTRFGAGTSLTGRQHWFLCVHLLASLAGPGRSGRPRPSRRCRGCSHPPRRPPDQAAPSFIGPLRRPDGEGLPPPLGTAAPRGAPGRR
jgi:hypothetical protein